MKSNNKITLSEADIYKLLISEINSAKNNLGLENWPLEKWVKAQPVVKDILLISNNSNMNFDGIISLLKNFYLLLSNEANRKIQDQVSKTCADSLVILKNASLISLHILRQMIESELTHSEKNSSIKAAYFNGLSSILKQIDLCSDISDYSIIKKFIDIFYTYNKYILDFSIKLQDQSIQEQIKRQKQFFSKNVSMFSKKLNDTSVVNDVTKDFQSILTNVIKERSQGISHNVKCKLNLLNEIEIVTNNTTYNLTQILSYEPNFNHLHLEDVYLDNYLTIVNSHTLLLQPDKFPVETNGLSKDIMAKLDKIIPNENGLKKCHASHCLAINIYTSDAYVIVNYLLRYKTITKDLFMRTFDDPNVNLALERIWKKLRGNNAARDFLTSSEINQFTMEAIMLVGIMAHGLESASSLQYQLSRFLNKKNDHSHHSHFLRGVSGDWVNNIKNDYDIAYYTGTPIYHDSFMSTTLNPNVTNNFIADQSKAILFKIIPFDPNYQKGYGVNVSCISAHKKEEEYLFSAGSLLLPYPESVIKNNHSYQNAVLNKKTTLTITDGNSLKSFAYSKEVIDLRNNLIQLYSRLYSISFKCSPEEESRLALLRNTKELIDLLQTTLKQIHVYASNQELQSSDISKIFIDCDIVILVTTKMELFIYEKNNNEITGKLVPISLDDFNKLIFHLNINNILYNPNQLQNPIVAIKNVDILKINCIEKFAQIKFDYFFKYNDINRLHQEKIDTIRKACKYLMSNVTASSIRINTQPDDKVSKQMLASYDRIDFDNRCRLELFDNMKNGNIYDNSSVLFGRILNEQHNHYDYFKEYDEENLKERIRYESI